MSEDLRQSLTAWGTVVVSFGIAWLLLRLGFHLPDWLRDGLFTLLALNCCWQVHRAWRRRRAGVPA